MPELLSNLAGSAAHSHQKGCAFRPETLLTAQEYMLNLTGSGVQTCQNCCLKSTVLLYNLAGICVQNNRSNCLICPAYVFNLSGSTAQNKTEHLFNEKQRGCSIPPEGVFTPGRNTHETLSSRWRSRLWTWCLVAASRTFPLWMPDYASFELPEKSIRIEYP